MVAIPSLTSEEEQVRDEICRFLVDNGVQPHCIKNNILALTPLFRKDRPTLMLCAHMDTVPACEGYGFNPFRPSDKEAAEVLGLEEGSFVAGLGSNDDGGSVVTMIAAFLHFFRQELPFNLMLCISAEEERSGADGSRYLWGEYWQNSNTEFPKPDFAIIGEPTSGKAATSERGLLVLDGLAKGVSGHAARNEGVNALYIAMDDIAALRSHRFEKVSPLMGEVKLSVTQIQAGSAHNVIPDSCSFVVDIRPTDCYSNTEILEELQAVCKSTLKARNLTNRSSATQKDGLIMKALEKSGMECFSSPTTSDWIRTRCDAVKMGPGESSRSHRKNEYILLGEMDRALEDYINLINNISL